MNIPTAMRNQHADNLKYADGALIIIDKGNSHHDATGYVPIR